MSVVLFIIILAVLIIVHEYGHFIVAKKGGIRVDEFGLGYPPKAKTLFRRRGTAFTLNWLPFGGFVKIFGENPDDESLKGPDSARAFVSKPKWLQALVLFAGPFMNFAFAWLIVLVSLWVGLPTAVSPSMNPDFIENPTTIVTQVLPGSPAETAGFLAGDIVEKVSVAGQDYANLSSESLRELVLRNPSEEFSVSFLRAGEEATVMLHPSDFGEGEKILGIGIENFGTYRPSFWKSLPESFSFTGSLIGSIAAALYGLIKGIFTGGADIASLSGPVGIVHLVGDASRMGLAYILSFVAIISVNLGIINLIPFPALDGGRLLFLGLEKIKGGRINPKITNWLNFVGFALLILLMLLVTYHDILKLV